MSYFAPYVDETGLHIPAYDDILAYLIESAKGIYGADIYLDPDDKDYQQLSVEALAMHDTMQLLQSVFNAYGPAGAQGVGLDLQLALNGITRRPASYSTCDVTLTGTPGTVISGGIVQDVGGYKWDLPSPITIGPAGTITVTAVCETEGAITALAGTLTGIATPTAGWTEVTNAASASAGTPSETDAETKARQAISTELPSSTLLDGTKAALAGLASVTRSQVYENDTNTVDANGLDPHSIWAVVEGGDSTAIAEAIRLNKGPGSGTNGTTSVALTVDAVHGVTQTIKFSRPVGVPVYVDVTAKELVGWTSDMETSIREAIVNYLNSLAIGEDVTYSALIASAMAVSPSLTRPAFSITALTLGVAPSPSGTDDIVIAFDHVSQGLADNVTVTAGV